MSLAPDSQRTAPRRAVVLAAGGGTRLRPFTDALPKALVEVHGRPLLVNTLQQLERVGVDEVVLVVGFRAEVIREHIGARFGGLAVRYVEVEDWERTGNICSVWATRALLDRDVFLIEGDVYLCEGLLERLLDRGPSGSVAAVASYHPDHPGSALLIDGEGAVVQWCARVEGPVEPWLKTVNVYLLEAAFLRDFFLPEVGRRVRQGAVGDFYESVLERVEEAPVLRTASCDDLPWLEIDDAVDLGEAWTRFHPPEPSFDEVLASHGSWWRHPFTDHALLCNVYFPPEALVKRLEEDLVELVRCYPSGQRALAEVLAKALGADPSHLVVANGASELIAHLCALPERGIVVPVPSFNEFEARADPDRLRRFALPPPCFDLDVGALAGAIEACRADWAVVVTPNNPTGRSVPPDALRWLADRLVVLDCRLLVDESFVEFGDIGRAGSVEDELVHHPNLFVLRSLSKVHGVAGLRIGYLRGADAALLDRVRRALPVWNVNGLAEAFLRLLPVFGPALDASCRQVRRDRQELQQALAAVEGVEVIPSQANFVLCRLPATAPSGRDVARRLFEQHAILVKDCAGKTMPDAGRYLRLAVRTPTENARLVEALRGVLEA